MDKHLLSVRIEQKTFEILEKLAKADFRSVNSLINDLIKKHIAKNKLTA